MKQAALELAVFGAHRAFEFHPLALALKAHLALLFSASWSPALLQGRSFPPTRYGFSRSSWFRAWQGKLLIRRTFSHTLQKIDDAHQI
jgi:hypothetical protein